MSIVNPSAREITAKVVYYGPGLSGKTTSLKQVYAGIRPETRGQLISLSTEGDRTLFFDFLPVKIEPVGGLGLRLQLYTVPGQVFYDATRKLVLNGADGVVFVADSQPTATDANLESMSNLEANLAEMGIDLASFPMVLQYNKRDLPGALPVAELRRRLNRFAAPEFETVANRGEGILTALREITRLVVKDLRSRQPHRSPLRPRAPASPAEAHAPGPEAGGRAPASQGPAATPPPQAGGRPSPGLSFARLFGDKGGRVAEVELLVCEHSYGLAVRRAAEGVAELLSGLVCPDQGIAGRALLLGLDGRELLRLFRLAAQPDGVQSERNALFALHLLLSAMVKAEAI
ncbi:MAG TPA: GTPase [Anaeromyxobacter sp.]|nr:GTPase [Anaeromyxobacter sp.]